MQYRRIIAERGSWDDALGARRTHDRSRERGPARPALAATPRLLTSRFVIVVTSGLFYFLAVAMLTPVLPHYVEDSLRYGSVAVGVDGPARFAFGAITLRLYAGRIGERYGRRVLIIGGALVVAASTLGVRRRPLALVAARAAHHHRLRRGRVLRRCGDDDHRSRARRTAGRGDLVLVGRRLRRARVRSRDRRRAARRRRATRSRSSCRRRSRWSPRSSASSPSIHRDDPQDAPQQLIARRRALTPGTVLFLGLIPLAGVRRVHAAVRVGPLDIRVGSDLLALRGPHPRRAHLRRAHSRPARWTQCGTIALVLAAAGIGIIAAWATVAGLVVGTSCWRSECR